MDKPIHLDTHATPYRVLWYPWSLQIGKILGLYNLSNDFQSLS